MAFEPRGQQWLLYGQWWWRNFWSLPIDLSMGTSWFPGSRMDNSWTLLNYFTNRNLLWFEGTYYLSSSVPLHSVKDRTTINFFIKPIFLLA